MRLAEVAVKNYRSIGSQTKFDVEDLTTLVGPNNEDKNAARAGMAIPAPAMDSPLSGF